MYDHILKNGRLTDKANGYDDTKMDIAVQDGVIVKIAPSIDAEAKNVIDLNELTVTPGIIDYHAHFYSGGTNTSLEFDVYPPTGVTFAVDAGRTQGRLSDREDPRSCRSKDRIRFDNAAFCSGNTFSDDPEGRIRTCRRTILHGRHSGRC